MYQSNYNALKKIKITNLLKPEILMQGKDLTVPGATKS